MNENSQQNQNIQPSSSANQQPAVSGISSDINSQVKQTQAQITPTPIAENKIIGGVDEKAAEISTSQPNSQEPGQNIQPEYNEIVNSKGKPNIAMLAIIAGIFLLLLGGGAYYFFFMMEKNPVNEPEVEEIVETPEPIIVEGPIIIDPSNDLSADKQIQTFESLNDSGTFETIESELNQVDYEGIDTELQIESF